jgi:hypothetical protein
MSFRYAEDKGATHLKYVDSAPAPSFEQRCVAPAWNDIERRVYIKTTIQPATTLFADEPQRRADREETGGDTTGFLSIYLGEHHPFSREMYPARPA